MNPIPTTSAMKPAPGKGVSSFPTPVIKDTVIVEIVNAWKGDYQPLEYGTKWDDVPHASVQGSFPDHKLISQAPNSEDGQFVKRIWANDRVDQDTYNYAIKYSGGSDAHPIYIRTYIEPRDTYAPVPDLSTDPLFPGAFLVEEEVERDSSELDSRYVKVTRVYETLPGPIIRSKRINERGDLETIEKQTVFPSTNPDPDGLFVTQTQVVLEDVSKGEKTTATVPSYSQLLIKEKKEGLLGETITTDDIVSPTTQPDELSQTIVASVVQQTSATKAVKRTTTASGPTSLTQQSKDGKLLGDVTIIESVVPAGADADTPSGVEAGILSSEAKQIDSGKSIKRTIFLNSTPTLLGSEKKAGLLGETTTTETVVAAGAEAEDLTESIVASSVEPIDATRSRKVTQTASGPMSLTGEENKSGLLGGTIITKSIVPAGEGPDELSLTVLSSSVDPIDSAKSEKTTVESLGPIELSTESLVDSPLGLVKGNITKSIVPPETKPENNLTTLQDKIDAIDEAKSERQKVVVNGNWPTIKGAFKDNENGINLPYEETIINPENLVWMDRYESLEFDPIDEKKIKKRTYLENDIDIILNGAKYITPYEVNVKLPNMLLKVTAYFGLDNGQGNSNGEGSGAGESYSYEFTKSKTTSASATGDIYFKIQKGYEGTVPGKKLIFFTRNQDSNSAIGLIKEKFDLDVLKYPDIKMISENLVIIGGSKSKTTRESESSSVSINGSSDSYSEEESYNVGVSANSVVVPETLHEEIEIGIETIGSLGELAVEYGVFPPKLAPTTPDKFRAGLYLMSSNFENYRFGWFKATCIIANIQEGYTDKIL